MVSPERKPHPMPLVRRQFLRKSLGFSFGTALAASSLTTWLSGQETPGCASALLAGSLGSTGFRLRYIASSTLFGTMPLEVVFSHAAASGAEAVDLWPRPYGNHREQADELGLEATRELAEKYGLRIAAISRYDLGPFRLTEEMAVLKKLGGELLITGCGRPKPQERSDLKALVNELVRALEPVAKEAESRGVKIAIENHSSTLLANVDALRWFAELNRYPALGVAFAPYHLPQDPSVLAQLVEELGQQLLLFYAWQYGKGCMEPMPKEAELEQLPGRGPLDFQPVIAALKRINFQGWTEIFMHSYPRGTPMWEDPSAIVNELLRAKKYLESCLAASAGS